MYFASTKEVVKSACTPHPKSTSGAGGGWVIPRSNFTPVLALWVRDKDITSRFLPLSTRSFGLGQIPRTPSGLSPGSRDHPWGRDPRREVGGSSVSNPATPAFPPSVDQPRARGTPAAPTESSRQYHSCTARWGTRLNRFCLHRVWWARKEPTSNTCRAAHTCARAGLPGPRAPVHLARLGARPPCQMGEGDAGGGDTHPAAPPPLPAAVAEPATPGTIFRRRLVLGSGYQPPMRHRQQTQPSASPAPVRPLLPRTRVKGRGQGKKDTVRPLGSGSGAGVRGPRPDRAEGPGRLEGTPRQRRGLDRAGNAATAGFVIVDSGSSTAEHAGKLPAGAARGGAERRLRRSGSRLAAGKGAAL
jgi:hypothetical protein